MHLNQLRVESSYKMIKRIKTWFWNRNTARYGFDQMPNGAKLPYGLRFFPIKNEVSND